MYICKFESIFLSIFNLSIYLRITKTLDIDPCFFAFCAEDSFYNRFKCIEEQLFFFHNHWGKDKGDPHQNFKNLI